MTRPKKSLLLATAFGIFLVSLACSLQWRLAPPTATPDSAVATLAAGSVATPTLRPQLQTPVASDPGQASRLPEASATPTNDENDDTWQQLRPGLERRLVTIKTEDGSVQERLYILRVDPVYFHFDVGYRPGAPQRLMDWQLQTNALIVVNGGFFTEEYLATGLVVSGGQISGTSYVGFGGMLAITDQGPQLRALSQQPYNTSEPLFAALQSFPILVAPDGQIGFSQEDGLADRRTVIAQDRQGRILLILATTGTMTLNQMSRYLVESDLDLAVALNLDGGASTGIQLAEPSEGVAPFSDLPIVILVWPR